MTTLSRLRDRPVDRLSRRHRNATTSSLLRLPGEVRNQIYKHIFSDWIVDLNYQSCTEGKFIGIYTHIKECTHDGSQLVYQPRNIVKIRTVCHQFHSETNAIIEKILKRALQAFWIALAQRLNELVFDHMHYAVREIKIFSPATRPPGFYIDTYAGLQGLLPQFRNWRGLERIAILGKE